MRAVLKSAGFLLVTIGLVGLLVTEFAVDWGNGSSRGSTLAFAAVGALGLAVVALAQRGIKGHYPPSCEEA